MGQENQSQTAPHGINSSYSSVSSSSSSSTASFSSSSLSSSSSSSKAAIHKLDAMELALNIFETFSAMTEDTESVADRFLFFSADDCHNLRRMLRLIAKSAVGFASTAENQGAGGPERETAKEEEEEEEEEDEEETQTLREEVTTAAACLLYRLCEMVKYSSADEGLDLRKLLRIFSSVVDAPTFYEAILRQMFRRIYGGGKSASMMTTTTTLATTMNSRVTTPPMTPPEAIALFQQFSVLNFTLQHNVFLANYVRDNFIEEFKYLIDLKRIKRMVSKITMNLFSRTNYLK